MAAPRRERILPWPYYQAGKFRPRRQLAKAVNELSLMNEYSNLFTNSAYRPTRRTRSTCLQLWPQAQTTIDVTRPTSANENARNIFDVISLFLTLRQLTEIWLNRTYVGETETRTMCIKMTVLNLCLLNLARHVLFCGVFITYKHDIGKCRRTRWKINDDDDDDDDDDNDDNGYSYQLSILCRINIMDNIMSMMEKYAYNLEEIVEERTQQLVEEKKQHTWVQVSLLVVTRWDDEQLR